MGQGPAQQASVAGGKTIIQTVQMPRGANQSSQQQQQQQQRNRNSHYAQIKQTAVVGNADNNDARRGRVIANRNAQPKKQYTQQPHAQAQYDNNHDIKTDYYQEQQQAPPPPPQP